MSWEIRQGDALERLREMEAGSVQTCISSPPYFGLRDYGHDGQIGLESTPDEYVASLVAVFGEVRRVLRDDGTLWLNLGDSYASGGFGGASPASTLTGGGGRYRDGSKLEVMHDAGLSARKAPVGVKPKDLLGIPWLVAFALRADGWYLRSEIIWHKPNPMPESVTDRPTRGHEQVFLLSKSARYFYDAEAVREPHTSHPERYLPGFDASRTRNVGGREDGFTTPTNGTPGDPAGRNKRSVWTVTTRPYPEAHFATFPPQLVEPMVLAGSRPEDDGYTVGGCAEHENKLAAEIRAGAEGKTAASHPTEAGSWQVIDSPSRKMVLDPFAGAGTTGLVALRHQRSFIGIELNPDYCELARNRLREDQPMFNVPGEVAA